MENVTKGFPFLSRGLLDRVTFPVAGPTASPRPSSFQEHRRFKTSSFFSVYFPYFFFGLYALFHPDSTTAMPLSSKRTGSQPLCGAAESCKRLTESPRCWNKSSPGAPWQPCYQKRICTMTGTPGYCCTRTSEHGRGTSVLIPPRPVGSI